MYVVCALVYVYVFVDGEIATRRVTAVWALCVRI